MGVGCGDGNGVGCGDGISVGFGDGLGVGFGDGLGVGCGDVGCKDIDGWGERAFIPDDGSGIGCSFGVGLAEGPIVVSEKPESRVIGVVASSN